MAAERRLAEGRSAEKPNQVDLARRAAAELSAPRDPLGLIPTAEVLQPGPGESPRPSRGEHNAPAKASTSDHSEPQPGPAHAADAEAAFPGTKPDPDRPGSQLAPRAQQEAQSTAGPAAAIALPQRPESARAASSAIAVGAASKAAAGPTVSRIEHAGPGPMRDRLWRHLERLGQRPARAHEATTPGSRAEDADAQPARLQAQLARGLAAALKQREGHVTLRLTPETLGKLRIDLNIADDRVTAQIAASTEQARRLLKENVVSLRTALEATGLGVDRIEVVGAPAEPASQPPSASAATAGEPTPSMASNGGAGEGGGHASDGRGQTGQGEAATHADGEPGEPGTLGMESTEYGYVLRVDFLA